MLFFVILLIFLFLEKPSFFIKRLCYNIFRKVMYAFVTK